jgi:hypothetical protein
MTTLIDELIEASELNADEILSADVPADVADAALEAAGAARPGAARAFSVYMCTVVDCPG